MNPEQALQILEASLNAAVASGVFKNLQETNAVLSALSVVSETLKNKNNVQENFKKPENNSVR